MEQNAMVFSTNATARFAAQLVLSLHFQQFDYLDATSWEWIACHCEHCWYYIDTYGEETFQDLWQWAMWLGVAPLHLPMGSNFINIGRYNELISCVEHAMTSICHWNANARDFASLLAMLLCWVRPLRNLWVVGSIAISLWRRAEGRNFQSCRFHPFT